MASENRDQYPPSNVANLHIAKLRELESRFNDLAQHPRSGVEVFCRADRFCWAQRESAGEIVFDLFQMGFLTCIPGLADEWKQHVVYETPIEPTVELPEQAVCKDAIGLFETIAGGALSTDEKGNHLPDIRNGLIPRMFPSLFPARTDDEMFGLSEPSSSLMRYGTTCRVVAEMVTGELEAISSASVRPRVQKSNMSEIFLPLQKQHDELYANNPRYRAKHEREKEERSTKIAEILKDFEKVKDDLEEMVGIQPNSYDDWKMIGRIIGMSDVEIDKSTARVIYERAVAWQCGNLRAGAFQAIGARIAATSYAPAVIDDTPTTGTKRSTERGEARAKLIAGLTLHHNYADGSSLHLSPIGSNELAGMAKVAISSASKFFAKEFGGHTKYRALCMNPGLLTAALRALNGEYRPLDFYGARNPDDLEQAGE